MTTISLIERAVSYYFADTAIIERKDAMKQAHKATKHVVSIMKASYSEVLRDALFVVYSIVKRCEALRIVEVHVYDADKKEIEVFTHDDLVVYKPFTIDKLMIDAMKVKSQDATRFTKIVVRKAYLPGDNITFDLDYFRKCQA